MDSAVRAAANGPFSDTGMVEVFRRIVDVDYPALRDRRPEVSRELEQLDQRIEQQYESVVVLQPKRGPILDRQGHQYFPTVGYKGGLRLLEKILGLLLDRKDRYDPETQFELVLYHSYEARGGDLPPPSRAKPPTPKGSHDTDRHT